MSRRPGRINRSSLRSLIPVLLLGISVGACEVSLRAPSPDEPLVGAAIDVERAREIKNRYDSELFSLPGVQATGLNFDGRGRPIIEVFVIQKTPEFEAHAPSQVGGLPVRVVETRPPG